VSIPDEARESAVPTRVVACTSNAVAVIEDDPVLSYAICEALRDAGLSPHPASSLPNARKIMGVVHPGAIVLDVGLGREDGGALLSELTREGIRVPTVLISADDDSLRRHGTLATRTLRKPFDLGNLVDAVLASIVD
jgi:DNA-binding response OmpR family regulator